MAAITARLVIRLKFKGNRPIIPRPDMPRPKTDHVKLTLRLTPEVHAKLATKAEANDRSLNAEILSRLRTSLSR